MTKLTPEQVAQHVTRALFALKTPSPDGSTHYQSGWDDALEAGMDKARDAVLEVLPPAPGLNPGEHRTVLMHDNEPVLKIKLPHGIGYVEIRNDGAVHGPTGYPVIGVEVTSQTVHREAANGRLYHFESSAHGGALVGEPGPKMLEQQRFMKEAAKIIVAHDGGDHSKCPDACTAKGGPTHEHRFSGEIGDGELCVGDVDCMLTWGEYEAGKR